MSLSPSMEYSLNGLEVTKHFESCRLKAYPDPGTGGDPWTIGWGHTGPEVVPDLTCTQDEADTWLLSDMTSAVGVVNHLVNVPVTQGQFDALVDFVFNAGEGHFTHSTLLKKLNSGDYKGADGEFQKWIFAGGKKMRGLESRRIAEADEFDDNGPTLA